VCTPHSAVVLQCIRTLLRANMLRAHFFFSITAFVLATARLFARDRRGACRRERGA